MDPSTAFNNFQGASLAGGTYEPEGFLSFRPGFHDVVCLNLPRPFDLAGFWPFLFPRWKG
jgi:hypothetical protein